MYGEATYDNTTGNPNNPNFPPKDVSAGPGSEDEMLLVYMNLSTYIPGDTSIIADTLDHYRHDAACFPLTGIKGDSHSDFSVYPNPTSGVVELRGNHATYSATVYNSEGKAVFTSTGEPGVPLDLRHLVSGIYYVQIKTKDDDVIYRKIVRR